MMQRLLLGVTALLLTVGTSTAVQQDARAKEAAKHECDMKKTESGLWCPNCTKILEKDDLDKYKRCKVCVDKLGAKYNKDKDKPREIEVCVKTYYKADCHPDKISDKPFAWDGTTFDKPIVDRARIAYRCGGCTNSAFSKEELTHPKACPTHECKKYCTKSPEKPHWKEK